MSQPGKTDLNFIGRNIRFFRRSRNWTLLQLANRIDIREGPLGRIERGLNLPSATVIYRLSKAFGISVDALFSPELSQVQATIDNNDSFFVTIEPDPDPLPKNLLNACHDDGLNHENVNGGDYVG
jgi:transcriptional regulator with XRE-family HTH domain